VTYRVLESALLPRLLGDADASLDLSAQVVDEPATGGRGASSRAIAAATAATAVSAATAASASGGGGGSGGGRGGVQQHSPNQRRWLQHGAARRVAVRDLEDAGSQASEDKTSPRVSEPESVVRGLVAGLQGCRVEGSLLIFFLAPLCNLV
jgi:hypothetical protein